MTRGEVFATIGWTVGGWLAVVGLVAAAWWVARAVRCPAYRLVFFLADWVRAPGSTWRRSVGSWGL